MRLVGKLNYHTVTQPNITYHVSYTNKSLGCCGSSTSIIEVCPCKELLYLDCEQGRIADFSNWAGSPIDRLSTSCYCVFVRANLVS